MLGYMSEGDASLSSPHPGNGYYQKAATYDPDDYVKTKRHGTAQSFSAQLAEIKNTYFPADAVNAIPEELLGKVGEINSGFAQTLVNISSKDDAVNAAFAESLNPKATRDAKNKENKPAMYERTRLVAVLEKILGDIIISSEACKTLSAAIAVLKHNGTGADAAERLSEKEWAYLDLLIDQVIKDWQTKADADLSKLATVGADDAHLVRSWREAKRQEIRAPKDISIIELIRQIAIGAKTNPVIGNKPDEIIHAETRLDDLSNYWQQRQSSQFALQILKDLKRVSLLESQRMAQEPAMERIAKTEARKWNLGYSELISKGGYLGLATPASSIGPSVTVNATAAKEENQFMDPEGSMVEVDQWNAGLNVETKFALPGLAKASATAGGQVVVTGDYAEYITPKAYSTVKFNSLIKKSEHRNNPHIARYLSRTRLLLSDPLVAKATSRELKKQLIAIDQDEVDQLDKLKTEYDLYKGNIEQRVEFYMSEKRDIATYQQDKKNIPKKAEKERPRETDPAHVNVAPKFAHSAIAMPSRTIGVIPAKVKCYSGKVSGNASAGLGDGLGVASLGKQHGEDLFSASASASLQFRNRVFEVNKRIPLCARWTDPLKVGREVAIKAAPWWWPLKWWPFGSDTKIVDEKVHIQTQLVERFNSIKDDLVRTTQLVQTDTKENAEEESVTEESSSSASVNKPDFKSNKTEDRKQCFYYLKKEYDEYKKLQAIVASGRCQNYKGEDPQALLRGFEKRYGAARPEQLLHRLVIANAYLFTHLFDGSATQLQDEVLKTAMKDFELALLNPPYAVDKEYLKEHCYYVEDLDFRGMETKFEAEGKVSVSFPLTIEAKLKLKISHREQTHTIMGRRGVFVEVSGTIAGSGNVKELIQSITPQLMQQMPPEEVASTVAEIEKHLNIVSPIGSFDAGYTFTMQFGRPAKLSNDPNTKEFPLSLYYVRGLFEQSHEVGISVAIPTGPVDITAGAKLSSTKATPLHEWRSADTFWYFILLNQHEHIAATIPMKTSAPDEHDQKMTANSYWREIERRDAESLRQLFLNYAAEREANPGDPAAGKLSFELCQFGEAIRNNKVLADKTVLAFFRGLYQGQTKSIDQEFTEARQEFEDKAKAFAGVQRALNDQVEYDEVLKAFRAMLHAIYPLWYEDRWNSYLLNPRKLKEMEKNNC